MPDLDTLIERAARQGAQPQRLRAAQQQLAEQMWRSEVANMKTSAVAFGLSLAALGVLGVIVLMFTWAFHSSLSNFADFPHGTFWTTYGAVMITLMLAVSIVRPRAMYGTARGPYTIAEDPLYWRDGPMSEVENVVRIVLVLPNVVRMSVHNLLSIGHLRRLKDNGDLALFVLLAAERRIVAEEVLLAQRKKKARELWSVIAALGRLEYLRYERLRRELLIWRGRAAEEMLGILYEG